MGKKRDLIIKDMKYIYLIIRKVIITRNLKYLSKKYRLNN
jgi:hypothetical protein